jgi:hypothetical protein
MRRSTRARPRSRGSLQWQQRPSAPKIVRQADSVTPSSWAPAGRSGSPPTQGEPNLLRHSVGTNLSQLGSEEARSAAEASVLSPGLLYEYAARATACGTHREGCWNADNAKVSGRRGRSAGEYCYQRMFHNPLIGDRRRYRGHGACYCRLTVTDSYRGIGIEVSGTPTINGCRMYADESIRSVAAARWGQRAPHRGLAP